MSVSLFIKSLDNQVVKRDIPVATLAFYKDVWAPISAKHNLIILANGAYGYEYDETALADFIDELTQFNSIIKSPGIIPEEDRDYIERRCFNLLQELEKLRGHQIKFSLG